MGLNDRETSDTHPTSDGRGLGAGVGGQSTFAHLLPSICVSELAAGATDVCGYLGFIMHRLSGASFQGEWRPFLNGWPKSSPPGSFVALGGQAHSTLSEGDVSSASKVGGSGASFTAFAADEGNFTKKKSLKPTLRNLNVSLMSLSGRIQTD